MSTALSGKDAALRAVGVGGLRIGRGDVPGATSVTATVPGEGWASACDVQSGVFEGVLRSRMP